VPLEKVASIGDDVIVVVDAASAVPVDQYPMVKEILDRDDRLVGKEVYTEAGSAFGKVVDVSFELPQGNITYLKVASRSEDDRPVSDVAVETGDVISIGPHAVVVRQAAATQSSPASGATADQSSGIADAPPTSRLPEEVDATNGWSARASTGEAGSAVDAEKPDDNSGSTT
jgi:sporulation protein YlmC with PRC-barrel domain